MFRLLRLVAKSFFLTITVFSILFVMSTYHSVSAATYAAVVMDARNGKILHSENANLRLHPASLTKMMTIYVAIQAVENGEIGLDTRVKISKFAASEAPSKIHLKPGSRVKLRYLIRAAAVRSANDAATAIAEAISGSEKAFAARMNHTARAMGMSQTTFKNAHGLTQKGHLSSAQDMTILGRHVIYNYPEYYHLFSKLRADIGGGKKVKNTNRNFLRQSAGADGIKTGFTNAAGFCLTASAKRGDKRIIVTVFGGRSGASRNAQVAKLMDRGFKMAENHVALKPPSMPRIPFAQMTRVDTNVDSAPGRLRRPETVYEERGSSDAPLSLVDQVAAAISPAPKRETKELEKLKPLEWARPKLRPHQDHGAMGDRQPADGILLGTFATQWEANRRLTEVMVMEFVTLSLAKKFIRQKGGVFEAGFTELTANDSHRACTRLSARRVDCQTIVSK